MKNRLFSSYCSNLICVSCGLTIRSRPWHVSLFHKITLSEFYIICICDVVLVLGLPMLSLTVVLRVLKNLALKLNLMYCIYIYFILFYIMYNIHVVKRFRAHCGFYAIENKLLLLLFIRKSMFSLMSRSN